MYFWRKTLKNKKNKDLMLGAELWVIGDMAGTDGRLELVEVPPAENTQASYSLPKYRDPLNNTEIH